MLHPLPLPLSSCLGCIPPLIGLPSLRFYAVGSSLFLLSVCFCLCFLFYRDDVLCWLLLVRPFLSAFHAFPCIILTQRRITSRYNTPKGLRSRGRFIFSVSKACLQQHDLDWPTTNFTYRKTTNVTLFRLFVAVGRNIRPSHTRLQSSSSMGSLASDSRFDLVWFRLSCDHGWIRSGSVNVRKQQQQQLLVKSLRTRTRYLLLRRGG